MHWLILLHMMAPSGYGTTPDLYPQVFHMTGTSPDTIMRNRRCLLAENSGTANVLRRKCW
jgi:hypothetical protein